MAFDNLIAKLKEKFGADAITTSSFRDNQRLHVAPDKLFALLQYLKEQASFDQLSEATATDYLNYPGAKDRFGVVYGLLNVSTGERVWVKTALNEPDLTLPSAYPLWRGADWMEREIYDMYGIVFEGHPDLRRILMPAEFTAFPLRKDYPLRGKGERHNFVGLTRAEG
jgi:NADH-quinone oxidoreductase subunit C